MPTEWGDVAQQVFAKEIRRKAVAQAKAEGTETPPAEPTYIVDIGDALFGDRRRAHAQKKAAAEAAAAKAKADAEAAAAKAAATTGAADDAKAASDQAAAARALSRRLAALERRVINNLRGQELELERQEELRRSDKRALKRARKSGR